MTEYDQVFESKVAEAMADLVKEPSVDVTKLCEKAIGVCNVRAVEFLKELNEGIEDKNKLIATVARYTQLPVGVLLAAEAKVDNESYDEWCGVLLSKTMVTIIAEPATAEGLVSASNLS